MEHPVVQLDGDSKGLQRKSYDYVMVFPLGNREDCDKVKSRLENHGLLTKEHLSRDKDEIFVLITANEDQLQKNAEDIKLRKLLKPQCGGAYHEFSIEEKDKFVPSETNSFFSSYERAIIIYNMITDADNAHIDVNAWIEKGMMSACFPMHDQDSVNSLLRNWVKGRWIRSQPLDTVREYFGEYIAMYFGWLEHYTRWLIFPGIVGLGFFLYGLISGHFDNPGVPAYVIFILLYSTLYLEFWKRRNSELVLRWDTKNFKESVEIRPAFSGEKRFGVYVDNTFVDLKADKDFTPPQVVWDDPKYKYMKFGAALSALASFLAIVVIATFGIFAFRKLRGFSMVAGIIAGVLNSVTIIILNTVYRKVAQRFTNWENHRTDIAYENSFIIKNFAFQFVNSYVSLFYIAFVKGRVGLFGQEPEVCVPDCMTELTVSLGTIFITNMFIGQMQEVGLPWILSKIKGWNETRNMRKSKMIVEDLSPEEAEAKMGVYPSAFDDYNEMVIQYGYCILFAAAFPVAPLAAFANNLVGKEIPYIFIPNYVEMRTDALKLLTGFQRPHPRGAKNIGRWMDILKLMNYLAVVTNLGMILFTSKEIESWYPGVSATSKIWAIIIAEFILAKVIPDVPEWVKKQYARRKFFKHYHLYNKTIGIQKDDLIENRRLNLESAPLLQ